MTLKERIKRAALQVGFDLAGVAPAIGLPDLEFARNWEQKGFAGEMHYLANPRRFDPRTVLPSVKSVICVGLLYNTKYPYSTEISRKVRNQQIALRRTPNEFAAHAPGRNFQDGDSNARAWVSRYAWGRDYHEVLREKLERLRAAIEELAPGTETRVFVDTGPVIERAFARHSGLGWMGKNTCILNEQKGSWFFLGVIHTNLALEPDLPAPDRCGSCTACLDACPTGALIEPYRMDATRCISYLTIELKGSIPTEFREAMGNNVFGCDICQDVCPWNRHPSSVANGQWSGTASDQPTATIPAPSRPATTDRADFQPLPIPWKAEALAAPSTQNPKSQIQNPPDTRSPAPETFSLFQPPLAALAALSEEDFRRLFRHSPIKRAKYRGWLRNLCVAMGNSGDPSFIPWLQKIARVNDALLREHAEWAISRLRSL